MLQALTPGPDRLPMPATKIIELLGMVSDSEAIEELSLIHI